MSIVLCILTQALFCKKSLGLTYVAIDNPSHVRLIIGQSQLRHARPRLQRILRVAAKETILILIMLGLYDNDSRSWPSRRVVIQLESRKRLCGTARELAKPAGYVASEAAFTTHVDHEL